MTGDPIRILLVDDNPDDRTLLERVLKRESDRVSIRQVGRPDDFNVVLGAGEFDIVVTDYHLQWSTGLDILRQVRARYPGCPVVMFTGTGSEEVAVEAMKEGLDDYVLKSPKHFGRVSAAVFGALRRREEQRLAAETRSRFEELFARVPIGLYRTSMDGEILDANPAFLEILGFGRGEVLDGVHIHDLYADPADRERWLMEMEREGVVRGFEVRLKCADGSVIWVAEDARLVTDERGAVRYCEGSLQDVTHRRRVEDALRRLAEMSGSAPDAVLKSLVAIAAELLEADCVSVGTLVIEPEASIQTLAVVADGKPLPNFRYPLAGTPCEQVLSTHPCVWEQGVQQAFPKDQMLADMGIEAYAGIPLHGPRQQPIGLIASMFRRPIPKAQETLALLGIFAGRATRELERRTSEEQMRLQATALASAENAIVITSAEGEIQWVNPAFERLTGYSAAEAIGRFPNLLKSGLHRPQFYTELWETIVAGNPWVGELKNRRKDGSIYDERQTITPVRDASGAVTHYVAVKEDVTELRQTLASLKESEDRYALAARGANDGLWDWDVANGRLFLSSRAYAVMGGSPAEIRATMEGMLGRIHPEDRGVVRAAIDAVLSGETEQLSEEFRVLRSDGGHGWVLARGAAVRDGAGSANRMAGSLSDITPRKLAEERLLKDAFYDGLTGLPNRALFLEHVGRLLERTKRQRKFRHKHGDFAVLFLDLDQFKMVNESLGYAIGDEYIVAIARRLENSVRPGDTLARVGGDDFVILLDEVSGLQGALQVVARIQEKMASPIVLGKREVFPTISIGVVLADDRHEEAVDLLRDAEAAMYRAKAQGGNRYAVFEETIHARASEFLRLAGELRRALERGEFEVWYQPIVQLPDARLRGFEALVRWRHPQRGLVPPGEFIPVAEQCGVIGLLGGFVLRESCRQFREWQEEYAVAEGMVISVNLSVRQFQQPGLVEEIRDALWATALPPASLQLEITESMLMEDPNVAIALLKRMRELGLGIAVDDFGTGYSSLSYLNRLPLDALKIDRSFVMAMLEEEDSAEIVRAVISLAHALKLKVVAEGVETEAHLKRLAEFGCDRAQGYFFAKPMPADQAVVLVRKAAALSAA